MVLALPCLQELTIGSKLSSVGAQQLGVLAGAHQLRCIHIPYGQALQDRSLQVRGRGDQQQCGAVAEFWLRSCTAQKQHAEASRQCIANTCHLGCTSANCRWVLPNLLEHAGH
jgi:hypothetical protein